MDFICKRSEQSILCEGKRYLPQDLLLWQEELKAKLNIESADSDLASQLRFKLDLVKFLQTWFDDSPELTVKTSGSTGTPKLMHVSKERMINSAMLTLEFLQLQRGASALLCMPLEYIAGKMVVVRALVGGLDLYTVAPCGHPLQRFTDKRFSFAAMIPLQVFNSLQVATEAQSLKDIEQLIIGGGAIDEAMERQLHTFPHHVWSTYGMTETLSHIALRRLNGPKASSFYQPFSHVSLDLTKEGTLVIDAPLVSEQRLVTNDIVVFNDQGQFRIKGRKDNVINSGGIKLQIEEIEAKIKAMQPSWDFQISAQPHPKFGQMVVLLLTQESLPVDRTPQEYIEAALSGLERYERPKRFMVVASLPRTGTNKPDRAQAKRLAQEASLELFSRHS